MQYPTPQIIEKEQILQHFEIQSIFYWVMGGIGIFASFFLFIYGIIFGAILYNVPVRTLTDFLEIDMINWIAIGYISLFFYVFSNSVLQIINGFQLSKKKNRGFSVFVAIYSLIAIPVGTAIGIYSLVIISRPRAKELFFNEEEKRTERMYTKSRF